VKAQVLIAGREKAGGILFANSPDEARKAARKLLRMKIKDVARARTAESKIEAFKKACVPVAEKPSDMAMLLSGNLARQRP
jgi:succinyl-CoA synthetase beta subunit